MRRMSPKAYFMICGVAGGITIFVAHLILGSSLLIASISGVIFAAA